MEGAAALQLLYECFTHDTRPMKMSIRANNICIAVKERERLSCNLRLRNLNEFQKNSIFIVIQGISRISNFQNNKSQNVVSSFVGPQNP